jgi:hypothetical protein
VPSLLLRLGKNQLAEIYQKTLYTVNRINVKETYTMIHAFKDPIYFIAGDI